MTDATIRLVDDVLYLNDRNRRSERLPDPSSVEALVVAARKGDRAAFRSLLEADSEPSYRIALAILGSPNDAQDALQDAALHAWLHLGGLRQAAAWPAWFRQIVVRSALSRARSRRRLQEVPMTPSPSGPATPDIAPAGMDRMATLAALATLSSDDRAVIGLRYELDLSVPEVAATLGIRLGTAKARIHRALRRLEAEMRETDG
jgi:RNA polymerase sigma factor (sigma-70 family)